MDVIFNADDFGLTRGVNLGIVEAHQLGVVNSTTLMVGMPHVPHACELALQNPKLKIGVHLTLTAGKPFTDWPEVTDAQGYFLPLPAYDNTALDEHKIGDELVAQIERARFLGLSLSHLDSHHHAHMSPAVAAVARSVAQQYDLPLRGNGNKGWIAKDCRYVFSDRFYGEALSLATLEAEIIKYRSQCDVIEFMCHPALIDKPLQQVSSYCLPRTEELSILTSPALQALLDKYQCRATDYTQLRA
uniref:chitin disaccharide deacetylase n=1 Tax=Thaumasiovibrio occultus TaxID=1891184 RepID=UPI000B353070|nr:chitin disaccharide deacetylase [Thaumasiovibrio occultus]